jgi:hypothetical protein
LISHFHIFEPQQWAYWAPLICVFAPVFPTHNLSHSHIHVSLIFRFNLLPTQNSSSLCPQIFSQFNLDLVTSDSLTPRQPHWIFHLSVSKFPYRAGLSRDPLYTSFPCSAHLSTTIHCTRWGGLSATIITSSWRVGSGMGNVQDTWD